MTARTKCLTSFKNYLKPGYQQAGYQPVISTLSLHKCKVLIRSDTSYIKYWGEKKSNPNHWILRNLHFCWSGNHLSYHWDKETQDRNLTLKKCKHINDTRVVFLRLFNFFIQQNFQLKILFHNSEASSNCHVCIYRTSRAKTKMDNITNRIRHSPLLICCSTSFCSNGSVFCTGLCK